jgi:HlyD family secretion protein
MTMTMTMTTSGARIVATSWLSLLAAAALVACAPAEGAPPPQRSAASAGGSGAGATVVRGDLVLEVDVSGTLAATRSAFLGPPSVVDERDFKISRMASEGADVKKGAKVLHFDAGELERELLDRSAERDAAAREIDRKRHEIELTRRESELRVTEAEAGLRKAELKADLPEQYTAAVEVRLARIDLEAAQAELKMAQQRFKHVLRLGQAELAYLRDRHARFAARVSRLELAIDRMAVAAPIDGVVVYRSNWRGEKKKVGDPCWVDEPCLAVTDVREMEALGEVDEVESARVAVGQTVRLRLEALPELEWQGRVQSVRPNVYRQSPRNPLKVMGIQIALARTDPSRMRPGMQFRGRLETGRIKNALLLPVGVVFARPEGPVVFRKTGTGWQRTPVVVGARTRTQVVITSGLGEGDRVSVRDLEPGSS